jgi:hypothetical protein
VADPGLADRCPQGAEDAGFGTKDGPEGAGKAGAANVVYRSVRREAGSAESDVAGDSQYEDTSLAEDKRKPSFVVESTHLLFLPPKFHQPQ